MWRGHDFFFHVFTTVLTNFCCCHLFSLKIFAHNTFSLLCRGKETDIIQQLWLTMDVECYCWVCVNRSVGSSRVRETRSPPSSLAGNHFACASHSPSSSLIAKKLWMGSVWLTDDTPSQPECLAPSSHSLHLQKTSLCSQQVVRLPLKDAGGSRDMQHPV